MQLTEKYRPTDWADVIGQQSICERLRGFAEAGELSGRAYWISGRSGTGKTTIARIIASKVSDMFHTVEMDNSELTQSFFKEAQEVFMYRPMSCGSRCYIVNEAHGLYKDQVRKLLKILEPPFLSSSMTWIFTTTLEGQTTFEDGHQDSAPLLSRCVKLDLEDNVEHAMAKRLKEIAQSERLDGRPLAAYKKLLSGVDSNMRAALQEIEFGAMKEDDQR